MDRLVTEVACDLDFTRSLVCKVCLKGGKSGSFEITEEMKIKKVDEIIDSVCFECYAHFSDPFSSTTEIVDKPVQGTSSRSNTFIINNMYGDINNTVNISMTYKILQDRLTEDQKMFLQKQGQKMFFEEQGLTTLNSCSQVSVRSIPKFDTILRSVCMIEGYSCGTGFLAKIPAYPDQVAFMSAGHIFKDQKTKKLCQNIDFSKYALHFGSISGDPSKLETCKLGDFGVFTGSIAYGGERREFRGNQEANTKTNRFEDYCVLLFPDSILSTLNLNLNLNLTCLMVGHGSYLHYQKDEVVSIFGHPGSLGRIHPKAPVRPGAREGPINPKTKLPSSRPLRVSFGVEKYVKEVENKLKKLKQSLKPSDCLVYKELIKSGNFLFYDNDTIQGNSGSPVIGRGGQGGDYAVKGIHVTGIDLVRTNGAQKLDNLNNWIPLMTSTPTPVTAPGTPVGSLTSAMQSASIIP